MGLRIAYRPRARIDLKEIYDWAAEGADPGTAEDYVKRIQRACGKLTDFPTEARRAMISNRACAAYRSSDGRPSIIVSS